MNKKSLELTPEQKIYVLSLTIYIITDNYRKNGCCVPLGKCIIIQDYYRFSTEIADYIPEFTYENAVKLSKKYKFSQPLPTMNGEPIWWWDMDERQPRLDFLNALVNEIQIKK